MPVLCGVDKQTPIREAVGHYWANWGVPENATPGDWMVIWYVQDTQTSQERSEILRFNIVSPGVVTYGYLATLSPTNQELVRSLRIKLSDNCIDADEELVILADQEVFNLTIGELWEIVGDASEAHWNALNIKRADRTTKQLSIELDRFMKIKEAFQEEKLKIKTLTKTGEFCEKKIKNVFQNKIDLDVNIYQIDLTNGYSHKMTQDHLVFQKKDGWLQPKAAYLLIKGDKLVGYDDELEVKNITNLGYLPLMYDLDVEDEHKFPLKSKLLVSNSPDKKYHFRPPATANFIQGFTEKFDYIWSDEELWEFIVNSLSMINNSPPQTFWCLPDIDFRQEFRRDMPWNWRGVLILGAMWYALMSESIRWAADEFSYSIGGISLDLIKSDKYESLASTIKTAFDQQLELAKVTVKLDRGLLQRPYGAGALWRTGFLFRASTMLVRMW